MTPSCRREMAQQTVEQRGISIRLARLMFGVSHYRYQANHERPNMALGGITSKGGFFNKLYF